MFSLGVRTLEFGLRVSGGRVYANVFFLLLLFPILSYSFHFIRICFYLLHV